VRIEADFFGEDLVASQILGVGERAKDLRPAFRKAADILQENAARQFGSAGAYGSGGWAPLAPSTVRRKESLGLNNGILQMTYRLRDSLTGKNADRLERINRQSFEFGTQLQYARFHQSGTSRMPRRRVLETTKSDRKQITRAIYERVMAERGRA
jgi:phage gpG-like protein